MTTLPNLKLIDSVWFLSKFQSLSTLTASLGNGKPEPEICLKSNDPNRQNNLKEKKNKFGGLTLSGFKT